MVNYNSIFLQKTGQMDLNNPWDDTRISGFLDNSAFIFSREYATPWADFATVPDTQKYCITIFAAIEYWWARAGEFTSKSDMQVGGGTASAKAGQMFDRAMKMISELTKELESIREIEEGSGDVLMGDLVRRSKDTGYLVPRADDPRGDWTSKG